MIQLMIHETLRPPTPSHFSEILMIHPMMQTPPGRSPNLLLLRGTIFFWYIHAVGCASVDLVKWVSRHTRFSIKQPPEPCKGTNTNTHED